MTATADLQEYVNKRVTLIWNKAGETEASELEGSIEAVGPDTLLLKPKGRTKLEFIPLAEIEPDSLHLVEETGDRKLKAKKIKPVELGNARSHLLERHGITLSQANEMIEEQAFSYHADLDHVALDLGHVHKSKDDEEDSEPEATE